MRDALAPLHHREFRLLFGGRVVSLAGSAGFEERFVVAHRLRRRAAGQSTAA